MPFPLSPLPFPRRGATLARLLLLTLMFLSGCRRLQLTIHEDLQYGSYPLAEGEGKLLLDLYLPTTAPSSHPLPVLIYIHGGGWREGSKEDCPGKIAAQRGYAIACVSYRLSDVARFPAQIHDVKEAVRWLRANADRYGLDADRFGAWGPSAGGHLSALLGTSAGVERLAGPTQYPGIASDVQAVCNWFGISDFTRVPPTFEEPVTPEVWKKYRWEPWFLYTVAVHLVLGGPVSQNLELAALANPINYIDKSDPPFLIVHGEPDTIVPIQQSELLATALEKGGVEVTFIRDPNLGHNHEGDNGELFDPEMIDRAVAFFDAHLKSSP
ncbi:MAG: alpha/beta hydrolase fold domain-containing protein [Cyanophyceae cyanobacterium]